MMTTSLLKPVKLPTISPKTELPYSDFLEFQRTNFMSIFLQVVFLPDVTGFALLSGSQHIPLT